MERQQYPEIEERRKASRFFREPDTAYAIVRHPSREAFVAQVREESLGGIGLILKDRSGFDVGQEVEIAYLDSLLRAIVRHIEPYGDGCFLVGFECTVTT